MYNFFVQAGAKIRYTAPVLTDADFRKSVGKFSQTIFFSNSTSALTATSIGNFVVWETYKPKYLGKNLHNNSFIITEGTRGRGRSRKTWEQCVRDDMKLLGLHPEWAIFRNMWRDLILGQTSNPSLAWKNGRFQNKWWWWILYSQYCKCVTVLTSVAVFCWTCLFKLLPRWWWATDHWALQLLNIVENAIVCVFQQTLKNRGSLFHSGERWR